MAYYTSRVRISKEQFLSHLVPKGETLFNSVLTDKKNGRKNQVRIRACRGSLSFRK